MPMIAVVTDAGAGVGRAAAEEFARNGYDVALLSRDPERLETAATALRAYGVRALPVPTGVADAGAVDAAGIGLAAAVHQIAREARHLRQAARRRRRHGGRLLAKAAGMV